MIQNLHRPVEKPDKPVERTDTPVEETGGTNLALYGGTSCAEREGRTVEPLDISAAQQENQEIMNIQEEARMIYDSGQALKFIVDTLQRYHVDDTDLLTALTLSYAATNVMNNEIALNIRVSGAAGTGKSHAMSTVAEIIPDDRILAGRFSDKALLYKSADIKPGTVFLLDDQSLSEIAAEIMKAQTSDVNKPYNFTTVQNGQALTFTSPERCVRWAALCDSTGDEQTADRELSFFADDSEEHHRKVAALKAKMDMDPAFRLDKRPLKVCKEILKLLPTEKDKRAIVQIPFADKIRFDGTETLRTMSHLSTMIRAAALLAAPKRNVTSAGFLIAEIDDFKVAAGIMNRIINGIGGSQKYKLTQNQEKILTCLKTKLTGLYLYKDLQRELKMSESAFSKAVNGKDTVHHSDGLLKINGINSVDNWYGRPSKSLDWDAEEFLKWDGSKNYIYLELDNGDASESD
ncbi:MAG: hypothetical protein Q4Q20_02885 [Methanocorpusculum sp.]|nr:hypothetical protein [Methanocorpusculum sp.]